MRYQLVGHWLLLANSLAFLGIVAFPTDYMLLAGLKRVLLRLGCRAGKGRGSCKIFAENLAALVGRLVG